MELHAPHQHVSRKSGRNAVACAAYRSGEKLVDDSIGKVFDYTLKQRVDADFILGWSGSRQELWQAVEYAEKRIDSKLADEHEIAFPRCLNEEQRIELARVIAEKLHQEYECAPVDACLHNIKYDPNDERDQQRTDNPHGHFMIATRTQDKSTETGLSAEKITRHWSKKKLDQHKLKFENESTRCTRVRALIADAMNVYLKEHDYAERVEHESFKKRGLEKLPTVHLGPASTALERRGIETERGNYNRNVIDFNARLEAANKQREQLEINEVHLDSEFDQVEQEIERVKAQIISLQAAKEARDAAEKAKAAVAAEQKVTDALARETIACKDLDSYDIHMRARMWRSATATDTKDIIKQRKIVERLEKRAQFDDAICFPGSAMYNLNKAEKQLEALEPRGFSKILAFAVPAEIKELRKQVAALRKEVKEAPADFANASKILEQILEKRQGYWNKNIGLRSKLADLCDTLAQQKHEADQAYSARLEAIEAREKERTERLITQHGYDPRHETHNEFLIRQDAEKEAGILEKQKLEIDVNHNPLGPLEPDQLAEPDQDQDREMDM